MAAHQPHDRSVIGEDADHVGAAFDHCAAKRTLRCDVQPLMRVGAPDLAPVLLGEVQVDEVFSVGVGQHVVAGGIHYRHSCWELLAQHLGDLLPPCPGPLSAHG